MNNNSSASTLLPNQVDKHHSVGLKEMSKFLPIAIAITLTNGLVFVMFYKRKRLRTASNYLLLGLAVCDFLTGTINIPYYIIFSFGVIPFNSLFSHCLYILQTLTTISAGYHILIITAEKYFAIIRPLKHRFITKTTICKLSLGIWMTSAIIALVPFTWRTSPLASICYVIHSAFCLLMVFLAPYVFMVYAFTIMSRAISKRKMSGLPNDCASLRFHEKNANDRKCILVFSVMATVYVICWLPYFTVMLIIHVRSYRMLDNLPSLDKAIDLSAIVRFMTYINPAIHRTKRMRGRSLNHSDLNTHQSVFLSARVTLVPYRKVNEGYSPSEEQTLMSTTAI